MSETLMIDREHPDDRVLKHAAEVVRGGGLLVYPTETLYGIGADATNPAALRRVPEAKMRTGKKPLLVVVDSERMMVPYVKEVPPVARILMKRFWPGPLTLVFAASALVLSELTQGTETIGIRIPSSQVCWRLLFHLGVPITSTSANISGSEPARTIGGMESRLKGIDIFLDAGKLPESQPSTIVDVSGRVPRVLRSGAIPIEDLRQIAPGIDVIHKEEVP